MKCRNCGAFNEDYMEYCENCASPLIPEESAPVLEEDTAPAPDAPSAPPAAESEAPPAFEGGPQASWGFVQAPRWIQPEFDANTISEEDIPAAFHAQSSYEAPHMQAPEAPYAPQQDVYAAPAYAQAQPQQGYGPAPMPDAAPRNPYQEGYGMDQQTGYPPHAAPYGAQPYGAQPYGQEQTMTYPASPAPYAAAPAFGAQPYGGAAPAEAQPYRGGMNYGEPMDDGYFSPEPSGREPRKRAGAKKPRKAKAAPAGKRDVKSLLFWIAAGVLVVLIIVFSIIFFTKRADNDDEPSSPSAASSAAQDEENESGSSSKPAFLGGLFSKNPITKPATIEDGLTTNGDPAYIITIYAKNNSTVRFTAGDLVKENPVEDGSLKLRAPRELWIPEGPVEEASIEVYPDIVVISKDGEEYPVEFDEPIVIDLPTIELSLSDPTTATVTTADGNVSVAGIVGDTTAEVFVNDTQLYLDESGNFAGTYTVPGFGTHEVRVEARKSGCQIARQSFSVDYPDPSGASAPAVIEGMGTTTPAAPAGSVPSNASSVAYVTTDDLNVRDQAAQSGNILGKLPLCTKVYIVMEDAGNGWAKILYNNAEAYASKQYLNIVATAADYRTTTATVNTDDLNLRSASSTSGESLAKLANGTTINYIKDAGSDWSMVEYNGLIGFVATQYISR